MEIHQEVLRTFFGNFNNLNAIQKESIPVILDGNNIIISSSTGTGKTEAVLAPLISKYLDESLLNDRMTWLYITPTKALANDIYRRINPLLSQLHLNVGIRHGDRDETRLVKKIHILITTPESLDVIMKRDDNSLDDIRAIILDEVHILYNTQRGLQMSLLISRLKQNILTHNIQIACLSATIASCEDISSFLFGNAGKFYKIVRHSHKIIDAFITFIENQEDLLKLIEKILTRPTKLLIFANSRKECDRLGSILGNSEMLRPHLFTHYSSLSTEVREETEKEFNQAKTAICIATSTLELGIDIGDIDAVILWGPPWTVNSFLQRIGRGNRRTKKTNAICLVSYESKNKYLDLLYFYAILNLAKEGIIEKISPMRLYGALTQQILMVIATNQGAFTRTQDIINIANIHDHLTGENVEEILKSMSEANYIKPHGFKHRYGANDGLYRLLDLRLIYGNIPVSSREIAIFEGKKEIGHISKKNLLNIQLGSIIRFAGRCWKVVKIEKLRIQVNYNDFIKDPIEIQYSSKGKYISDTLILNRIYDYLSKMKINFDIIDKKFRTPFYNYINNLVSVFSPSHIPLIRLDDNFCYLTFGGKLCNLVFCQVLGINELKIDQIGIVSKFPIDFSKLPLSLNDYETIIENLFSSSQIETIFQSILPESIQKKEFFEEWRCNPEITKLIQRLVSATPKEILIKDISWLLEID